MKGQMDKFHVPQDDENFMQGKTRDVCYVVDENGNYTTALSSGWEVKNIVFKQTWNEINENLQATLEKVRSGELSPIAYFMEKSLMDIKLLSAYTNFTKRKIKKHFKPSEFAKLDNDTLQIYADVFGITLDELKNNI